VGKQGLGESALPENELEGNNEKIPAQKDLVF